MELTIGEKILLMRESERLSNRKEAADLIGIPNNALWRYETGEAVPKADMIMKILNHPRFEKYALWFVTGKTAPESGQIAPALYDPKNYEQNKDKTAS
ncbi:helix-turn-helix transcriptional regulator [Providencia sp.]|uniref:helix-turn-helix domain-containing protein n=1 Tax=Providencia sp. TaxID=589 RepID=UPI00333F79D6